MTSLSNIVIYWFFGIISRPTLFVMKQLGLLEWQRHPERFEDD